MKGQIGLETLFVFGFLIFIFLFIMFIYFDRSDEINFASKFLEANKICNTIRESVNHINMMGSGSKANFNIPSTIEGQNYNVSINSVGQSILVSWNKNTISCPMITRNVSNSTDSFFLLNSTSNIVRNDNGIILVQSA